MLPDLKTDSDASAGSGAIQRVLIVDDSRLQRRILAASLRKWGFEVVEADCGASAMEICEADAPDLILSDWMMPGMNGLEFCQRFRALSGENYSYFILLTSKSEKNAVAEGLDAGADDFLTKPVSSDELRARISAGERILRMQRELSEKNRIVSETLGELQRVYDAIDKDLIQARKIQQALVPELSRSFGNSNVSLLLKPCGHIGGDLVGMFSPGENRAGFYAIDVSGHGITSAMMTARLGGYLSSVHFDQNVGMERRFNRFYSLRPPEEVAAILNARLLADSGVEEYFTMAYCTVDLTSGVLRMVQAGHPHPLLLRRDGSAEFLGSGGLPVGLVPDASYSRIEVGLEPGDRVLLYSDGFAEARLKDGRMLEDEGLLELVQDCAARHGGQALLSALYGSLTDMMPPGQGLEDDVSATLFEFGGA